MSGIRRYFDKEAKTVEVTFTKNFKRFKNGQKAYMHEDVAAIVTKAKAGTVKKVDFDALRAEAKKLKAKK